MCAARRVLEKLKSGDAPHGEGALLHLAIRNVDANAKLEDLAAEDGVRDFLLKRFSREDLEIEEEEGTVPSGTDEDGHPCVILRAIGKANNLRDYEARCEGVLVITICDEKLYLLRMYAFPTEYDEEGLTVDLDYMEGNALELLGTPCGQGPPSPSVARAYDPAGGTEIVHRDQKWRIRVHEDLHPAELTEDEDAEGLLLKITHNDAHGSCALYMYARLTNLYIAGERAPPPNLMKWMTEDWWNTFTTMHPVGELHTWQFPGKQSGKYPTFITLPDLSDEANRIDISVGETDRPVEVSYSGAKKMGFVEKPETVKIGKEGKGGGVLRGCLEGIRPRIGRETVFRYAWRSPSHSYQLLVMFTRDGYKKYGDAMRQTVESLEFVKKWK